MCAEDRTAAGDATTWQNGHMMSSRQIRVVRGVAAAVVATFVALLSHLIAGGEVPGPLGILVPLVASTWPAVLLAGRRLSLWRLSLSVAISQALFHMMFMLGAAYGGAGAAPSHHAHGFEQILLSSAQPGAVAAAMHADPLMWFWHGVAAVVTIAMIHRGERALLRLRELAARIVEWLRERLPPVAASSSPPARRHPGTGWTTVALTTRFELSPLRRRGPPPARAV